MSKNDSPVVMKKHMIQIKDVGLFSKVAQMMEFPVVKDDEGFTRCPSWGILLDHHATQRDLEQTVKMINVYYHGDAEQDLEAQRIKDEILNLDPHEHKLIGLEHLV